MKTTLTTFIALFLLTLTASAGPILLVKTTITQNNSNGTNKVLSSRNILMESGKQAVIQGGGLEYVISAKLKDDGTILLYACLAEKNNETKFAAPPVTTKLGG